jgi:hypothetical protein
MMRYAALALLFLSAALPSLATPDETLVAPKEQVPLNSPVVNVPLCHENLAVYILENPKARSVGNFITLDEGLRAGKVRVTEKQSAAVNELQVDNGSNLALFIQAGDIVRGGHQDRAIAADVVIPPHTQRVAVPSFCVEHDRWGSASGSAFGSTTGLVVGAKLRSAIQKEKDQDKVWKAVADAKAKLVATNSLRASKSGSLNEQLLDQQIQHRVAAFSKVLGKALDKKDHAVGLVTAINGKVSTSDVYADPALFRKLYPRLLASAAMEAMCSPADAASAPAVADVSKLLVAADKGKPADAAPAAVREGNRTLQFRFLFENAELHRQSLVK